MDIRHDEVNAEDWDQREVLLAKLAGVYDLLSFVARLACDPEADISPHAEARTWADGDYLYFQVNNATATRAEADICIHDNRVFIRIERGGRESRAQDEPVLTTEGPR
jgi:hypothetical protein